MVEAVLIVGSILLAFIIDAAWEQKNLTEQEREILLGVSSDLEDLIQRLEFWADFSDESADLLNRIMKSAPSDLRKVTLDSLFSSIIYVNVLDKGGGTLEALIASGRLEIIEDEEIRNSLARWPDRLEDIHTNDLSLREFIWHEVMPFLAGYGIPQEYCDEPDIYCVKEGPVPTSYLDAMADPQFKAYMIWKSLAHKLGSENFLIAAEAARELKVKIETHLRR